MLRIAGLRLPVALAVVSWTVRPTYSARAAKRAVVNPRSRVELIEVYALTERPETERR